MATRQTVQPIILDTNVISEMMRPQPDPTVGAWYVRQTSAMLYTTAVTLGEALFGLGLIPHGKRRAALTDLAQAIFDVGLRGKILPFDESAARHFGPLRSESRQRGRSMEALDMQIAAIALATGFSLATRNMSHFEHCDVTLINPWLP